MAEIRIKHLCHSAQRLDREKRTVRQMVEIYCRHEEGNRTLCPACRELLAYAHRRLDACKFGHSKPACQHCRVHCYTPARREQIRRVMRYAGPRMPLYHPLAAIRHLLGI